jgi:hypothetical protein
MIIDEMSRTSRAGLRRRVLWGLVAEASGQDSVYRNRYGGVFRYSYSGGGVGWMDSV